MSDAYTNIDEAVDSLFGKNPTITEDTQSQEEQAVEEGDAAKLETEQPVEDSDTSEEDDEGVEDEEPLFTVQLGDKTETVTLTELQKGYQRQSDYTRKAQDLAAQRDEVGTTRNELTSELEQYRTARENYAELVTQLSNAFDERGLQDPDPELYEQDPVTYLRLKDEVRTRREKQTALRNEQLQLEAEKQKEIQDNLQKILKQERGKLIEAVPAWSDETVHASEMAELRQYALTAGYAEAEIANAIDSRAVLTMRKAMLYDKMVGEGKTKLKSPQPRVVKGPSLGTKSRASSAVKRAREKFNNDQSIDSAVDMILAQRKG